MNRVVEERTKRTEWYRDARFGMFIHWGLYCIPGGCWKGKDAEYFGEWIQAKLRIPAAEYAELAKEFNPDSYNPDDWCRLFRDAGMKYAIFTAKHHEGFSMYHTKVSDFNVVDASPYGRDPLAEFAASCRKYGIRLGIYYSHDLDWHEPDGGDPGPQSDKNVGGVSWGNDWDFPDYAAKNFHSYFKSKVIPQVTELLTNYGEVSVIWFDCPNTISPGESRELRELVHRLQPECLISGRIGNNCGDFISLGDNQLPGTAIPRLVECPATLNDTWGFKPHDHNWKSAHVVIGQLLELAEKKVNYLLNVGPRPDGQLPPETIRILSEIAEWRKENDDAFNGTEGNPFPQLLEDIRVLGGKGKINLFFKAPGKESVIYGILFKVISAIVRCHQAGDALTLDTSPLSGMWPRVILEIKGVPQINSVPPLLNGTLLLIPQMTDPDKPYVAWNSPEEVMKWEARFPQSGEYIFYCITESAMHSRPWCGNRKVELCVNGERREILLEIQEKIVNGCYPRAESNLGVFLIKNTDPVTISLRTLDVLSEDAEKMNLIALRIQCVSRI